MKAKYLYRHEFPSNEEGFRPIQIRINKPDTDGYPKFISLSCGRYFFPFSIKDLDDVIKELLLVREECKK